MASNVEQRQPVEIAASVLFIVILRRMRTSNVQKQLFPESLPTVFTWPYAVNNEILKTHLISNGCRTPTRL